MVRSFPMPYQWSRLLGVFAAVLVLWAGTHPAMARPWFASAKRATPGQMAYAFYSHETGWPTKAGWMRPYVSDDLYRSIARELRGERRALRKKEPLYLKANPFTGNTEAPLAMRIAETHEEPERASVRVVFTWPGGVNRSVIVKFRLERNQWRIIDFVTSEGSLAGYLLLNDV